MAARLCGTLSLATRKRAEEANDATNASVVVFEFDEVYSFRKICPIRKQDLPVEASEIVMNVDVARSLDRSTRP